MNRKPVIILTVDYPEGCRNRRIRISRRTRYFPRDLTLTEVMIVEGNDGKAYYDVFRLAEEMLFWRVLQ